MRFAICYLLLVLLLTLSKMNSSNVDINKITDVVKKLVRSPSDDNFAKALTTRLNELNKIDNIKKLVKDKEELVQELAIDFKIRNKDEPYTDEEWLEIARHSVYDNEGTGFTRWDSQFVCLENGEKFDEIHEFMHILSATGGDSDLKKFKSSFNEGSINYWAEKVCEFINSETTKKEDKINIIPRYITPHTTPFIRQIVKIVGEKTLYDATFFGAIDEIFKALATNYVNKIMERKNPNDKDEDKINIARFTGSERNKPSYKAYFEKLITEKNSNKIVILIKKLNFIKDLIEDFKKEALKYEGKSNWLISHFVIENNITK